MLEVKINTTIHIELNLCSGFGKRDWNSNHAFQDTAISVLRIIESKAMGNSPIDLGIDPLIYTFVVQYALLNS